MKIPQNCFTLKNKGFRPIFSNSYSDLWIGGCYSFFKFRSIILVPRDVVYGIMGVLDPKGLEDRRPNKKTKKWGKFESPGANFVFRLDGHDKLMGTKIVLFHWLFMGAWIHAVARSCGCMYGQLIVIQLYQHFGMLDIWKKRMYSQCHYDLIKALRQQP